MLDVELVSGDSNAGKSLKAQLSCTGVTKLAARKQSDYRPAVAASLPSIE